MRALLGALVVLLFAAAPASAAPGWLDPVDLSAPGKDASSNPSVAMDGSGDSIAIWERQSTTGGGLVVQASIRRAGGAFASPVDLASGSEPRLAMAASGEAVAVWKHFDSFAGTTALRRRSARRGNPSAAPVTISKSDPGIDPKGLDLAIDPAGATVLVWRKTRPGCRSPMRIS